MENENIKSNKKSFIILLLIIAIIGIIIMGYYFVNNSSSNKNNDKEKNVEIDNKNEDSKQDAIDANNNQTSKSDEEIFNEIEDIIENELYVFYGLDSIDDLSSEIKAYLAISLFQKNVGLKDYIENFVPLKSEDLKKEFDKSSLGKFEFVDTNIPCMLYEKFDHYEWTYHPESDTYEYTELGHGGSFVSPADKQIIKKNKDNGLYVISYKYLWEYFGTSDEEEISIYKNFEDEKSLIKPLTKISRDYNKNILIETKATEVLSELDTYTYIFELIDNKLYLKDFNRN